MKPIHFWIAVMLLASTTLNYFDRIDMSVAAPELMKEFSISPTRMGMVFAAFQVTYALLMVPGGHWADRFGPRNVLAVTSLGAGLLTALMSLGAKPGLGSLIGVVPALIVVRLGFGAFTAPLFPTAGLVNANWIPVQQRTRVQALILAGAGAGAAVAPPVFGALMRLFGWRQAFVLAGVTAMALAVLCFLTVGDRPAAKASAPRELNWRPLLRNRNLQWLVGGYAAINYFEYIFYYWLYYYLGQVRKLPAAETAFYTSIPFVVWALMIPLGGWATDVLVGRVGPKAGLRSVAVGFLAISALCLFGALRVSDTKMLVALLSLAFGFCGIADTAFWSAAISLFESRVGAACGLLNAGGNLGGGIAPVLTPIIAETYGWSAGLCFGGLACVVGLLAWLRIDIPEVRDEAIQF